MSVNKGQELALDITDVAFGGKGIAKVDGFAVFVDGAAPQERVLARIIRKKRSWAEARIVEILSPSPFRITPPCPYATWCGGCKWQFLEYATQLRCKTGHVEDSLRHIGLLEGVPVHDALPSEKIFGYRNKMEFSAADRRWLLPHELGDETVSRDFALGLHVPGTFDKILDIRECLLQPTSGNAILSDAKDFMMASSLPAYGIRTHEGFWRFLMLRHSASRDEWMVNVVTRDHRPEILRPLAERLVADHPGVVSVVNNVTARKAGISVGESEHLLAGQPFLTDAIGAFSFDISANSFFQTNTAGAARLYDTVLAYAGLTGQETVFDLYCGTGTISIFLARAASRVLGIEIVEDAVADARKNAERNGITNCRFLAGDMRTVLASVTEIPDVMVIDPPRAGMHGDVVRRVLELRPERIVYVSCNPTTLARDLALLKEIYRVEECQPVDMFPHTFHIESVTRLTRI